MKRVRRPCNECPWRKDSEPGRFAPERWAVLAASSADERGHGPDFVPGEAMTLFACHKTPEGEERACAGWLAVEGRNHPGVRLDILTGALPACSLDPGPDWPPLHPTFAATMRHDLMED